MKKYFILAIMAISFLSYSCGGDTADKDKDKTTETDKKEDKKEEKEDGNQFVGKWTFESFEVEPAYLKTKASEVRSEMEDNMKTLNEDNQGTAIEFFKSMDYKHYDKYGKEDDHGTYELRSDGKDLVTISEVNGDETKLTVKSISGSKVSFEMTVENETDVIPFIITYKK